MSRSRLTIAALAAMGLLAAGCSGAPSPSQPAQSGDPSAAPDAFTYALVTPGAAGDGGFIDSAIAGTKRAEQELGVAGRVVEAESIAQQEGVLRSTVATHPGIIIAPGLQPDSLLAVAEANPNQLFGVPSDIFVSELPDNVQAFAISMNQSSFLGGYVAGTLTTTKKVGAVLGADDPNLNQFYFGYKQGVLAACPDCEVTPSYLNGQFGDPSLGQESALALYQGGSDIIYAVAGLSGQGVIAAAKAQGKFAIGVDSDQDGTAPGTIIVSVMKRVDTTTFDIIKAAKEGNFTAGFNSGGMADGYTGLSWDAGSTVFADNGPAEMVAKLPDLQAQLKTLQEQVINGELEVCDALNEPTSAACAPLGVKG